MIFRKAILLVHGFAGGLYDYGTLANDLQLYLDFDVYTFTLPGHDKMVISKVKKEDWIKAAETQVETLIKRGYKKIYIIGHSMGGVIACHLAKKYPQVKKLILAAPAFRYFIFKKDKFDLIASLKQAPELIKDYTLEGVLSRVFKVPINTALEFTKLVKEHYNDPKDITCPTLIIYGNNDKIVPIESPKYVHNNIKSTVNYFFTMDNVTHDIFTSPRREEITNMVTKFLRNNYIPKKIHKNI